MERARLRGWSFHDLRHFFVTELFRNGASAAAIQQLARHADLATTQRYADLDVNDLRSAVERIDGDGVETAKRLATMEPRSSRDPLESWAVLLSHWNSTPRVLSAFLKLRSYV